MLSPGSSRRFAPWVQGLVALLLAVVMGLILGLIMGSSLIAAGSRIGAGIAIEGAALRDCVGGDQAHNQDAPGQPPPRLLDAELCKDSDDDGDEVGSSADFRCELPESCDTVALPFELVERRSEVAQRIRQCHGARGPPLA